LLLERNQLKGVVYSELLYLVHLEHNQFKKRIKNKTKKRKKKRRGGIN